MDGLTAQELRELAKSEHIPTTKNGSYKRKAELIKDLEKKEEERVKEVKEEVKEEVKKRRNRKKDTSEKKLVAYDLITKDIPSGMLEHFVKKYEPQIKSHHQHTDKDKKEHTVLSMTNKHFHAYPKYYRVPLSPHIKGIMKVCRPKEGGKKEEIIDSEVGKMTEQFKKIELTDKERIKEIMKKKTPEEVKEILERVINNRKLAGAIFEEWAYSQPMEKIAEDMKRNDHLAKNLKKYEEDPYTNDYKMIDDGREQSKYHDYKANADEMLKDMTKKVRGKGKKIV